MAGNSRSLTGRDDEVEDVSPASLWYAARIELGMDRGSFLATSPRELDGLLEGISARERRQMIPGAMVCSVIANVNRDPGVRPDPWTIADFLPGGEGSKSKEEEMIEFIEALDRGETFMPTPEEAAEFKRKMRATFNLQEPGKPSGEVTTIGPAGKQEAIH